MEELLEKYYEYFLKLNHDDRKDFRNFYNLIVNKYDIEANANLTKEFREYQKLFNVLDSLGGTRARTMSVELRKKRFERKRLSFDFFEAPDNLYATAGRDFENSFVHTQTRSENVLCKAYLSIKPEAYITATIKLQEFINHLFQEYPIEEIGNCKFRSVPGNDAIVLRLTSKKQLDELTEFVQNNNEIKDNLDLPNPFIPQLKGIGIMPDDGKSYNDFVTSALWNYMLQCKNEEQEVTASGLIQFIQTTDFKKPFTEEEVSIPEYREVIISKLMSISDKEIIERVISSGEYENEDKKTY